MKISVVIPIYKVEKYVERCARSLFDQTLDEIEYIFVDDCSPDNSIAIIKKVLEDYPKRKNDVKIIRLPENRGQAYGRKIGIQECTGDYVIHCDGDDWIEPQMYEKMYNYAISGNYDIVRCNFCRDYSNYSRICKAIPTELYNDRTKIISKMLLGYELTSLVDKLVKKEIVHRQDIIWPVCNIQEDHVLVLQYIFYSRHVGYLPDVFYHYCCNLESTTRTSSIINFESRFKQVCQNTELIVDFLHKKKLDSKLKSEILYQKFHCKNHLFKVLNKNDFAKKWLQAYPEVNTKFMFATKIPIIEKIRFLIIRIMIFIIIVKKHFLSGV